MRLDPSPAPRRDPHRRSGQERHHARHSQDQVARVSRHDEAEGEQQDAEGDGKKRIPSRHADMLAMTSSTKL